MKKTCPFSIASTIVQPTKQKPIRLASQCVILMLLFSWWISVSAASSPTLPDSDGLRIQPQIQWNAASRQSPSSSSTTGWLKSYWVNVKEVLNGAKANALSPLFVEDQLNPNDPAQRDAARLLTQATFGPTEADILRVAAIGPEQWIDEQLTLMGPAHLDYVLEVGKGSDDRARNEAWWLYFCTQRHWHHFRQCPIRYYQFL